MPTIEESVAALTTATTALTTAVGVQQSDVNAKVAAFAATTARVNVLNNVNNTTDANKPVSTAQAAANDTKQATLVSGTNISTINGQSLLTGTPLVIERSATSLNELTYDNRGLLRTPALPPVVGDSTIVEGLGLFQWINAKVEPEDDETCFNTTTGQWLLKLPAWDLIDAWIAEERAITDDWREDEPTRFAAYLATYFLNNK